MLRLQEVYNELQEEIAQFKRAARIDCPNKCRKCCETARFVEVSTFEMLPLSIHLWEKGKAEIILKQLKEVDPEGPCVLLNRNPSLRSEGGCRYYSFRPLICRLFGFSAIRDKYGNPKTTLCKPLKELNPGIEERIDEMIPKGLRVPFIPDYSRRVSFLHPSLGHAKHPINFSLRQVLEEVGQKIQFRQNSEL